MDEVRDLIGGSERKPSRSQSIHYPVDEFDELELAARPTRTPIEFRGHFVDYFLTSLLLLLLSVVTFGLAAPYWMYWSFKYFFTKLEIDGRRVRFTGHFVDYFLTALLLTLLSVITFGLAFPYLLYWSVKYFFAHLEYVGPDSVYNARWVGRR